jgi:hypothetical protein
MLAESGKQSQARNQQLEEGATAIIQTFRQVSHNQAEAAKARIPLTQGHLLWPLAVQLNLFLDRYYRAREAEVQLEATTAAINELVDALYSSTQHKQPLQFPPLRKTPLDALLLALGAGKRPERGLSENHS